ncbi:uncharacterized protein Fot_23193 [Forsythia ovata]|uniref:Myb/SANT-like domain-containing protein n=1 Tax=Forsythia ovata TaxID=205694 RepID=A0ABD1UZU4_9LAMI
MAHQRQICAAPIRVSRPTTATDTDDIDINTTQVDHNTKIRQGCGVVVSDKNVRARLKTLKKEYAEVNQLLSISGFGWDVETGRITADSLAWDDLVKLITEKLEALDLDLVDIMKVMKVFRLDGDLAKVFMSLTNTTFMHALVFEQLGGDPPPLSMIRGGSLA